MTFDSTSNSMSAKDLAKMSSSVAVVRRQKKQKKWTWKKPKGKPNRPPSAYNLFFRHEHLRTSALGNAAADVINILTKEGQQQDQGAGHEYVGLTKSIAQRWRALGDDERAPFIKLAAAEKEKYKKVLATWKAGQANASNKEEALRSKPEQERQPHINSSSPPVPNVVPRARVSHQTIAAVPQTVSLDPTVPKSMPCPPSNALVRQVTPDMRVHQVSKRQQQQAHMSYHRTAAPVRPAGCCPAISSESHQHLAAPMAAASALRERTSPSSSLLRPSITEDNGTREDSDLANFLEQAFNKSVLSNGSSGNSTFPASISKEAKSSLHNESAKSALSSDLGARDRLDMDQECFDFFMDVFST